MSVEPVVRAAAHAAPVAHRGFKQACTVAPEWIGATRRPVANETLARVTGERAGHAWRQSGR
jgi:hypothetical protein